MELGYIRIAQNMLNTRELHPELRRMLHIANERVQKGGGDGPVYGKELRSTQVIASIIGTWESLPKKVRFRR